MFTCYNILHTIMYHLKNFVLNLVTSEQETYKIVKLYNVKLKSIVEPKRSMTLYFYLLAIYNGIVLLYKLNGVNVWKLVSVKAVTLKPKGMPMFHLSNGFLPLRSSNITTPKL